jgi:hypothetical protein
MINAANQVTEERLAKS